MEPRQLRCSPARPAPDMDPPVHPHLQESPVCHSAIQGAFLSSETEKRSQGAVNKKKHFSLKEWSGTGTGCPGRHWFPVSGSVQDALGSDLVVMMVGAGLAIGLADLFQP